MATDNIVETVVEPVVQTTEIPDVTPRPVEEDGVGFGLNEKGEFSPSPTGQVPVSPQVVAAPIVPVTPKPLPVNQPQAPSVPTDIAYQLEQGRQAQQTLATLFRDHGERIIPLLRGEVATAPTVQTAAQAEQRNAALVAKCKELWGDVGPEVAEYVRTLSDQIASEKLSQALGPVQKQVQQLNAYYVQQQCRDVASNWREQLVSTYKFPQQEADEVIQNIIAHPSMRDASPDQLHQTIQTVLLQYLPGRSAQSAPAVIQPAPTTQIPTTRVAATMAPSAPMQAMRANSALVNGTGAPGDGVLPADSQRAFEIQALRDSQRYRSI